MGTRNLTMVILDKKTVVAQYGQWDGYPTGQGETIQKFLRTADLAKFKERLKDVHEIDEQAVDNFLEEIGSNDGWLGDEQSKKFNSKFPGLSRDHGADILNLIYDGTVTKIRLREDFKKDSLFCEYWYAVNLDDETVTMNGKIFTFEDWKKEGFMEKLQNKENER
jgi:hypothetical protein